MFIRLQIRRLGDAMMSGGGIAGDRHAFDHSDKRGLARASGISIRGFRFLLLAADTRPGPAIASLEHADEFAADDFSFPPSDR